MKKKLYVIGADERYPDFDLSEDDEGDNDWRPRMELSAEEFADYERACAAYEAWQERLQAASAATVHEQNLAYARRLKAGEDIEELKPRPGEDRDMANWRRDWAQEVEKLAETLPVTERRKPAE